MNFSEYLQNRQEHLKLKSAAEHYRYLGGKKKLGIGVRYFQQISSGVKHPTAHLLAAIFDQVDTNDKRIIIVAFFRAIFNPPNKAQNLLLDYIENHLTPAIEGATSSVWDKSNVFTFLNDEQLEFLNSQPAALRCYQKTTLLEKVKKTDLNISELLLEKLISLKLLTTHSDMIIPTNNTFRIPTYANSGSSLVRAGNDLISKILSLYFARDGHPNQEVHFRIQLVTKTAGERILEQLRNFNKWVQSLATEADPDEKDLIPVIFYGVTKIMDMKEL